MCPHSLDNSLPTLDPSQLLCIPDLHIPLFPQHFCLCVSYKKSTWTFWHSAFCLAFSGFPGMSLVLHHLLLQDRTGHGSILHNRKTSLKLISDSIYYLRTVKYFEYCPWKYTCLNTCREAWFCLLSKLAWFSTGFWFSLLSISWIIAMDKSSKPGSCPPCSFSQ